jgi:O-antigen ligase
MIIFVLLKKSRNHYLGFGLAVIVAAVFAGPSVRDRFSTIFANKSELDASAESRIDLWRNCLTLIQEAPLMGVGPGHFILVSQRFGWAKPKEAHSTWLQSGAELGIPGMAALLMFHGWTLLRLLQMVRGRERTIDPWCQTLAYAVIAGLIGFMVSATFVTVHELEIPYYLVLLGAGILKVSSRKDPFEDYELANSQATSPLPCDIEHYQQMDFQRSLG